MTHPKPSDWQLVLILMWYVLLCSCALLLAFFGLIWGSEVYRGGYIPVGELAMTYGPLLATTTMLIASIKLWDKGKRKATYIMFAGSLLIVAAVLSYTGIPFL
jgi:hypothetical protein